MMTPSQLKEYEFKTAGRNAYKADDVDDFFAEVAANYTKMFHENGELVRRVGLLADRLEKFKKEEEEIKSAVVSAQRAADIIVRDAKNSVADAESEAEAVLAAAKSEAELIKSDAEKQAIADSELLLSITRDKAQEIIKKAKEEAQDILIKANSSAKDAMGAATRTMTSESLHYDMLKKEVAQFKSDILNQYKTHIELISKLPDLAEEEAKKLEKDTHSEESAEEDKKKEIVESEIESIATKAEENIAEIDVSKEVLEAVSERENISAEQVEAVEEEKTEENKEINNFGFKTSAEPAQEPNIFEINANVEADVEDLVEDSIEITLDEANGMSADDFAEPEEIRYVTEDEEINERVEALHYFSTENKDELMEVDEEMLTQDGEMVVKTDLPLSFFDDADNLEFVDDFDGMERDDESSSFSFSSVKNNINAKKRPMNRVTVDSAYLDFLASETDEEETEEEENVAVQEENEEPQKRGFFKRK
ncbi:MAG: DivIVA domain-containing protein [Clostridia bacterium]|nr:DivIVA domain-containing protein [Clostridia bacterium]